MPPKNRVPPTTRNGFVYEYLGVEDQREVLRQRIRQAEADHFNQANNRIVIASLDDSAERDEALLRTDAAIRAYENVRRVLAAELAALDGT